MLQLQLPCKIMRKEMPHTPHTNFSFTLQNELKQQETTVGMYMYHRVNRFSRCHHVLKRFRVAQASTSPLEAQDGMRLQISSLFGSNSISGTDIDKFMHNNINSMKTSHLIHMIFCSGRSVAQLQPSHIEKIITQLRINATPLKPKQIGSAFVGVRKLECTSDAAASLLKYLCYNIDTCDENLTFSHIAQIMFGLEGKSSNQPEIRDILTAVLNRLEFVDIASMAPRAFGTVLIGCKSMSCEHKIVRRFVRRLSGMLAYSHLVLDPFSVRLALKGLSNMSSKSPEVRELVGAIAVLASRSCAAVPNCKFTLIDVSVAMSGLKNMSSAHPEVCKMMGFLTSRLRDGAGLMDELGLAMLLQSLQNKSSDHAEVREYLNALSDLMEGNEYIYLSDLSMGQSLFSVQGLKSEHAEVRRFVAVLAKKIDEIADEESAVVSVISALYGLRRMDSSHQEVKLLVAALTRRILKCKQPLVKPSEIALAMVGLNKLSSDCQEVRELLDALLKLCTVKDSDAKFTAEEAAKCVNSFYCMSSDHVEVRRMVAFISRRIESVEGRMNIIDVTRSLNGLRGLASDHAEVLSLVATLNQHFKECFTRPLAKIESNSSSLYEQGTSLMPMTFRALESLGRMDDSHPDVERLVHTFINPIEQYRELLFSSDVVAALSGLRSMSSEQYFVRGMMVCLADKLRAASRDFSEVDIRKCMAMLDNKSSAHREVRDLLEVMAMKIQEAEGVRLSSTYVDTTMSSLPALNLKHAAVKLLVKSLYVKCVLPTIKKSR